MVGPFDDMPERVPGKNEAELTAKWLALSQIETSEERYDDEAAVSKYLKDNPKVIKKLKKELDEGTVEWVSDSDVVSNVNVEEFSVGQFTTEDVLSFKWLQVKFNFDTELDLDDEDLIDALRFGFALEVEFSTKEGYVVFRFRDIQDNSINFL